MTDRELPTGTVTFLFSDIEGSTRLLQKLGRENYAAVLDQHNLLFRESLGAAVVSTEGDSFFCAFDTPGVAVQGAIDVQRAIHGERWLDGTELWVRMGLHTGEGILGGDNYVGLDVHKAARISAAAHGGQILISAATRALIGSDLPDGASVTDLGEHRLKDLAHVERLFQVSVAGLRDEFPPPNSVEAAPVNLPELLSSFVGRKHELDTLLEPLAASRLVTLVGIGGSGKTRLSIEAAAASRGRYGGGVFFIALGDVTDGSLVAKKAAADIGVSEQVGRPIEDTLVDYLRPREALLVLDNCEQVVEDAAKFIGRLLGDCRRTTVLATSREALLIPGERLVSVDAMTLPSTDSDDVETILSSDAVRLFVTRSAEAAPDFRPEDWALACLQICRRLEGIPLAIELAAARSGMLNPEEILARLDDRFRLLTGRSRGVEDRHATLEAAIDWSYDLLKDDLKKLLRGLSVFRGGFTIEAARQICFEDQTTDTAVLDHMTELGDKSLLSRETQREPRFRLLETIREYAEIRLHGQGEYESAARRHREYFTQLARDQSHRLSGPEQLQALEILEAEHDNFRAVMRRAMGEDDHAWAVDMAGWLTWFWYIHAHFTEGERWTRELLETIPEHPTKTWLRLLIGAAQYDFRIGHYDRAESRLRRALDLATEMGLPRLEMWAHAYLATNDMYRVRMEDARREVSSTMKLATDIGDPIGIGYAVFLSVGVELWPGSSSQIRPENAQAEIERLAPVSLAVRSSGERNMIGHVLQTEGILLAGANEISAAARTFDEAILALSELGQVGCACHCLDAIAEFVATLEKYQESARLIGAANSLRMGIGVPVAPVEEPFRSRAMAICEAALGQEESTAETDLGALMSLPEAAQMARETLARI